MSSDSSSTSRDMDVGVDLGIDQSLNIFLWVICISVMLIICCCVYERQDRQVWSKRVQSSTSKVNSDRCRIQLPPECFNLGEINHTLRRCSCGLYTTCVCDHGSNTNNSHGRNSTSLLNNSGTRSNLTSNDVTPQIPPNYQELNTNRAITSVEERYHSVNDQLSVVLPQDSDQMVPANVPEFTANQNNISVHESESSRDTMSDNYAPTVSPVYRLSISSENTYQNEAPPSYAEVMLGDFINQYNLDTSLNHSNPDVNEIRQLHVENSPPRYEDL